VCCSVLQCVAVCCSASLSSYSQSPEEPSHNASERASGSHGSSVTMCCSVLQCVAVCCSVLQNVAMYCSVLQCVAVHLSPPTHKVLKNPAIMPASEPAGLTVVVLQYVAVCCSVLQCVAVRLSPPTHKVLKNPAIMPASEPAGLTVVAIVGEKQFWLGNAVCCVF